MDHLPQNQHGNIPPHSANFGTVPNDSEPFGSVRKATEEFRSVPQISERKESHTLTVREVARMFEAAGVARTERSIVNWCQPSRTGIARLDSYFDPNERRYFISAQSVEHAITEEKARMAKRQDAAEGFGTVPQPLNDQRSNGEFGDESGNRVAELERENIDLRITNRAKDIVIERMQKERDKFFDQLVIANRSVGALEGKLLQIEASGPTIPD
jgi:hypothetical protein